MSNSIRDLAYLILQDRGPNDEPLEADVEKLAADFREKFGKPVLPQHGETVAVALRNPKVTALFYDRIWWPPSWTKDRPPDSLLFYGATNLDIWLHAVGESITRERDAQEILFFNETWRKSKRVSEARFISELSFEECGVRSTPVYSSDEEFGGEFPGGQLPVLIAGLSKLAVVDESQLSWQQVVELRRDPAAVGKIRRLRTWAVDALGAKSATEAADLIFVQLENYEWALKKFGLPTLLGSVSEVLDIRTLSATTAAAATLAISGQDHWLQLAIGGGVIAGRTGFSLFQKLVVDRGDYLRTPGAAIAFVHELKKLAPPKK